VRIAVFVSVFVQAWAWCRVGLRSGTLSPSFACRVSLVDLSRHQMSDFQYFSLLPVYHGFGQYFTSGTRSNSSTRQLTMLSFYVVMVVLFSSWMSSTLVCGLKCVRI
jgi:hypothetical protein